MIKLLLCIMASLAAATQRAFVITQIENKGILLMESYKKDRGSHFQLPGGRIDPDDFEYLGYKEKKVTFEEMVEVAKIAARREFKEELGINDSSFADKLVYLDDVTKFVAKKKKNGFCNHTRVPKKFYFHLTVNQSAFDPESIKLSAEHIGFNIQPNIELAISQTIQHSGGDSALALERFFRDEQIVVRE